MQTLEDVLERSKRIVEYSDSVFYNDIQKILNRYTDIKNDDLSDIDDNVFEEKDSNSIDYFILRLFEETDTYNVEYEDDDIYEDTDEYSINDIENRLNKETDYYNIDDIEDGLFEDADNYSMDYIDDKVYKEEDNSLDGDSDNNKHQQISFNDLDI